MSRELKTPKSGADDLLQITRKRGRVNFGWWFSNHDLLGMPAIVRRLFTVDMYARLRRPAVLYILDHGGSITNVAAADVPAVENALRRWLRRWIAWPGAGRFAQGYSEVSLPQAPQAPSPGHGLSEIEVAVDRLFLMDDMIKFLLELDSAERSAARVRHVAAAYGRAGDELLHRFCPAIEDAGIQIGEGGYGTRQQMLGDGARRSGTKTPEDSTRGRASVAASSIDGGDDDAH